MDGQRPASGVHGIAGVLQLDSAHLQKVGKVQWEEKHGYRVLSTQ